MKAFVQKICTLISRYIGIKRVMSNIKQKKLSLEVQGYRKNYQSNPWMEMIFWKNPLFIDSQKPIMREVLEKVQGRFKNNRIPNA